MAYQLNVYVAGVGWRKVPYFNGDDAYLRSLQVRSQTGDWLRPTPNLVAGRTLSVRRPEEYVAPDYSLAEQRPHWLGLMEVQSTVDLNWRIWSTTLDRKWFGGEARRDALGVDSLTNRTGVMGSYEAAGTASELNIEFDFDFVDADGMTQHVTGPFSGQENTVMGIFDVAALKTYLSLTQPTYDATNDLHYEPIDTMEVKRVYVVAEFGRDISVDFPVPPSTHPAPFEYYTTPVYSAHVFTGATVQAIVPSDTYGTRVPPLAFEAVGAARDTLVGLPEELPLDASDFTYRGTQVTPASFRVNGDLDHVGFSARVDALPASNLYGTESPYGPRPYSASAAGYWIVQDVIVHFATPGHDVPTPDLDPDEFPLMN